MELSIYWTNFAEKELEKIFKYHKEKASYQIAKKLVKGIYSETIKLKTQPRIGQVETILKERSQEFRHLIYKNYKIINWLNTNKNQIEIFDVFDTRQNPTKIKRTK